MYVSHTHTYLLLVVKGDISTHKPQAPSKHFIEEEPPSSLLSLSPPFPSVPYDRFPLEVGAGQGGVFSVDWTAGSLRYQADRVFNVLDGSVFRLEVTEIGTEDAETFLPLEKF